MAAELADKLPIATFAHLPFVEHAVISPDGTRWAGLFGVDGTQIIAMVSLFDKNEKSPRLSVPDFAEARYLL